MNHYDVKRLALVLAVQAVIEGMKVQNQTDIHNGMFPRFTNQHFEDKSIELTNLAYAHEDQL